MSVDNPFTGVHLRWPYARNKRPFVVRVIEPSKYDPLSHAEMFHAALNKAISPNVEAIDQYSHQNDLQSSPQFDLLTFPEAFLDAETLVNTLKAFPALGASGCVHTGLRPAPIDKRRHLFSVAEMQDLIDSVKKILPRADQDLTGFCDWLCKQDHNHAFNLGCLFLNDADSHTRICIHPKVVRSKFEQSPNREAQMHEANLLNLVTLLPARKKFGTLTLQPLICSDLLNLPTDVGTESPMEAVNKYADCFGENPPDHVDVVSVATCSPQVEWKSAGQTVRCWHEQFRESFTLAARGPGHARHYFAAIVLANFNEINTTPAGLSGVFLPVPAPDSDVNLKANVTLWGRSKDDPNNRWSYGQNDISDWESRGFIATLEPAQVVKWRMLCFTINRLPREASSWHSNPCLVEVDIHNSPEGER